MIRLQLIESTPAHINIIKLQHRYNINIEGRNTYSTIGTLTKYFSNMKVIYSLLSWSLITSTPWKKGRTIRRSSWAAIT